MQTPVLAAVPDVPEKPRAVAQDRAAFSFLPLMNIGISSWRGTGLHAEDKGCGFGLGPQIQAPYSQLLSLHLPQLWTRAVVFKLLVADNYFSRKLFHKP